MAGPSGMMPTSGRQRWEPTTVNVVVLVVAELAAFAALRWFFRQAHGG